MERLSPARVQGKICKPNLELFPEKRTSVRGKFTQNNISLYLQDCVQGMKGRIKDKEIDVVVTSPPYNLGINYSQYDDRISRKEYLDWAKVWVKEVARVLSDDGSFFLNISGKPSDPWGPFEVLSIIRNYFCLQNTIHWIKAISIKKNGDFDSFGHYKPVNSDRFLNDCHEYIFHLTKECNVKLDRTAIGVPYQDKSNVKRWKIAKNDVRCRGNTWFIPYKTIQSSAKERPHPATFPVELAEMCIKVHGLKNTKKAMDPFLGIGNAALAAMKLNIPFVGFEIDKEYFEISHRNIEKANAEVS